ncbi:MAG: hypothetical protein HC906_01710 [Bacteroidales bacterium]|nr:hypothetical protein [Bacteroidales bacterium]
MMVYDQRIKYYSSDKGDQRERMAIDLLRYRRDDLNSIVKANDFLKEAIQLEKKNIGEAGLATYLTSSISLFQNGMLDASKLIDNYFFNKRYFTVKNYQKPF